MKAILVDDEPDGIRTLKRMLGIELPGSRSGGYLSNAIAAKQKLEKLSPDLVFLDIQMPGKSGLDMLEEISEKKF